MNREEAIKHLETYSTTNGSGQTTQAQHEEAKRMGIKALEQEPKTDSWSIRDVADTFKKHGLIREQEPSDDVISRQAVLDMATTIQTDDYSGNEIIEVVDVDDVKALPPATPQPKTGYWIFDDECKEHGHCSCCGYGSVDLVDGESHNFCRNCGAKLIVEPQERSNKE